MTEFRQRILVVGPSWVGDMVMSQVLYRLLQQTQTPPSIDVLAPAWSGPILDRMPEVERSIALTMDHGELALGGRRRLARELREGGYDQCIVLPNSFKSALIPFFARIPRRTGWLGEMRYGLLNDVRRLDEKALPLMIHRFAALALDPGQQLPGVLPPPRLSVDAAQATQVARTFGLRGDVPVLALCPGAEFGGAKRWPAAHYADLAADYLQRGWQVVLYGSANDQPVTDEIRTLCARHANLLDLAGRTQLAQAVDLLSLSSAVVSNDSGLMHIAAALACPLVVIYGATSPAFTPPLNDNSVTLVSDIECAPCFQRECPLYHHRCMREVPADAVAAKLDALLAVQERLH